MWKRGELFKVRRVLLPFSQRMYSTGTSKSAFEWSGIERVPAAAVDTTATATASNKTSKQNQEEVRFTFHSAEFKTHLLPPFEQNSNNKKNGKNSQSNSVPTLPTSTLATKDEMMKYYEQMWLIRRMELAADALYKAKLIRGFCHLQTGQEAVPVGIEAALNPTDSIITAYRCHGYTLLRDGGSVKGVLGELMGKASGVSKGKGGSMHMYGHNFYGGNGIVGAQVPLGTGIAFANKYRNPEGYSQENPTGPVTFALYGDGAANQGQIFEVYNIAALLQLPVVFVCENNFYSMGTSIERSSFSTAYYTRGDYIPGIQVNGMDVLAVREASRFAKTWCQQGRGPLVLEMVTYRYGGHSMSDPGTTYRTRDEIQAVRSRRDAIKLLRRQILDAGMATEDDLKTIEEKVKERVQEDMEAAKLDPSPSDDLFFQHVYQETPDAINPSLRGCEYDQIYTPNQ